MHTESSMSSATAIHRRTLLQIGAALVGGAAVSSAFGPMSAQAADTDFATIVARRREQLVGGKLDGSLEAVKAARKRLNDSVSELRSKLNADRASVEVFTDLPLASGAAFQRSANLATTFGRLSTLVLGYSTPDLPTTGSAELLDRVIAALRVLQTTYYRVGGSAFGNWFQWEIGIPIALCSTLSCLGDKAPADLRTSLLAAMNHFTPDANYRARAKSLSETGANRINKSLNAIIRGALGKDAALLANGRDALSDRVGNGKNSVFAYVTSGDGFYADGSFIQHDKMPYAGQYGAGALEALGPIFTLTSGTDFAITDPNTKVVFDSVEKTFAPFMWNGRMIDISRGRAVSRQRSRDYDTGAQVIGSVIALAPAAPPAQRKRYLELAKGWIERGSKDYLGIVGLPQIAAALPILKDTSIVAAPEPVKHIRFPAQERSVHRRKGWLYTVATSSIRIGRYEWGNSEDNEGWYQGDGFAYLYLDSDQDHYSDEYWPTVNNYRLPGTIVSGVTRENGATSGTGIPPAFMKFSGGVDLEPVGVVGFAHLNFDKTVSARQSWFMLEDRVVTLAADISSTADKGVFATIEQRNLGADGSKTVGSADGKALPAKPGEKAKLSKPDWMHVSSVGGYLFLSDVEVDVVRETRKGAWSRIGSGGTTGGDNTVQSRDFLTASINLGSKPTSASYAYEVLPNVSLDTTKKAASDRATQVLANTGAAQVVLHGASLLGNFFAAATTSKISADAACSVIVRKVSGRVEVALSDPSRRTGVVKVTIPNTTLGKVASADPKVTVAASGKGVVVTADLGSTGAATRKISWTA